MNFQKFKTNSYCVDGRHYSPTNNVYGDKKYNKKTSKQMKMLMGTCTKCNKNKSIIVSDQTIEAEGLGDFLNTWEKPLRVLAKKF